ncbi:hypothetical protein, partial [Thermoleptolyngbya sp. C42_A2020_037]|uniref:hypothetical protein n=1 Tax=Thermoleptolyngbya sp. C42_A2020_037 TaxID=2747799 RepID=UPI0025F498B8
MRKDSSESVQTAYYAERFGIRSYSACYAELFCLFTLYWILDGKIQSINSYLAPFLGWGSTDKLSVR